MMFYTFKYFLFVFWLSSLLFAQSQSDALLKLSHYTQNTVSSPQMSDYLDAGIVNLGSHNLDAVNAQLLKTPSRNKNTQAKVQAVVDAYNQRIAAFLSIMTNYILSGSKAPVIVLNGDAQITLDLDEEYTDFGAYATDASDQNITSRIVVQNNVNIHKVGTYTVIYTVTDSAGNKSTLTRIVNVIDFYLYIPKVIDDATAIRFLNKATFGATKESIENLKNKGVKKWLDEQLSMPYVAHMHLRKTIEIGKAFEPIENPDSVESYLSGNSKFNDENNKDIMRWQLNALFHTFLFEKDQLRHRVAYALSQIVVENLAEPYFRKHADGLSAYMDILTKNAFGNYKDLLLEISHSSSMGVYLTYNGSQKKQIVGNTIIYPDENYAREIMQLFSIGLNKLNLDGSVKLDAQGKPIATYTQEDVNNLARVFTGWEVGNSRKRYGELYRLSDITHPLKFVSEYHDFEAKRVLGQTIPAGNDGDQDMEDAINILMSNSNIAPFISKQLIMRLTKSNPSPDYVRRVASVFNDNGKGVKGDLKSVVRAIFLDRELWEDNSSKKFKEPFLAYMEFLRTFEIEPLPLLKREPQASDVPNAFALQDTTDFAYQCPTRATTVFNFYDNNFIPNDDYFKEHKLVAPELQIQPENMLIAFSNKIKNALGYHNRVELVDKYGSVDKIPTTGREKYLLNLEEEYNIVEKELEGSVDGVFKTFDTGSRENDTTANAQGETNRDRALHKLIEHLDKKITGGRLLEEQKEILFNKYIEILYQGKISRNAHPKVVIFDRVISPIIRFIVTSEINMVE